VNARFLQRPAPRWFTIPAHRPFVDDLAAGLVAALGDGGPEALSDAVVLTPTRRAARALAEAFVTAGGGRALLLPQIRALGDLDEGEPPFEPGDLALDLPPAISPWRRRFELARLVADNDHLLERRLDAVGALEMADALAGFLDSLAIEEATPPADIDAWVEAGLARHWQVTARFLALALEAWPARLADLGLVDVAARRVALLRVLAERWTAEPPAGVLVAAGSTGTAPATAALLKVIAHAPKGCVVLPGLDQDLAERAWEKVDEQHPQGAMRRLLASAGIARRDVAVWSQPAPGDARGRWRRRIVNEALRPAEATDDWLDQIRRLREEGAADGIDPVTEGMAGLSLISARTEDEAAATAALLLRETLETPGRTAALITPDAVLARRVSARLARWGVVVDSSAGAPLAGFPAAELTGLLARATAERLDPVLWLALLKHPLVRLGRSNEGLAGARRRLERYGLRGPRPRDSAELRRRLADAGEAAEGSEDVLAALEQALEVAHNPFTDRMALAGGATQALSRALEALATDEAGDVGGLWAGAGSEALVGLLSALIEESDGLPPLTPAQFADLVEGLLAGETVRAGAASHPRLRILGAIEARLVRADRLILAGLEEGVWPVAAPIDPFLSRPLRALAGLPPPERRIGLSAHDFAQAACAPEVVLLHCERRGGAPSVASRWLWRLQTLAAGAGVALPSRPEVLAWARALDAPVTPAPPPLRTAPRPRPVPPVDKRPTELPVTAIETWVRDPYAVYARRILGLRPLERPDEPVDARIRGSAIHKAFERYAERDVDTLFAEVEFSDLLMAELTAAGMAEARLARERALAGNAAAWVVEFERRRRPGARFLIEQTGRHSFATGGGRGFTLTVKADRIEARDGLADILDFKTGSPPTRPQVASGLSPQLTLTAAILHHGGFADLGPATPGDLVYVRVSGGRTPGEERVIGSGAESLILAMEALAGLKRRVAAFEDPATPYVSWAAPQFIGRFAGDYDHLARLWEWYVIGEDEAEGGA
jgi:ATP-dependent helicase/nuclease subunit B